MNTSRSLNDEEIKKDALASLGNKFLRRILDGFFMN